MKPFVTGKNKLLLEKIIHLDLPDACIRFRLCLFVVIFVVIP